MKMKLAMSALLLVFGLQTSGPEGWQIFDKVTFKSTYFEEIDSYFEVPTFDETLKNLEGTTVTISGYFIPIEVDTIFVLSGLPFSSCFFCGGAGPETVAEVRMDKVPNDLFADDLVKVEGKLKLNATNIDYMNFIIREAKIVKD
ncbi:MAG: hypothetical protein HEP71_25755 [Roseivirga sp.]|nr:hypothetical protein [Roseivirga sp.]